MDWNSTSRRLVPLAALAFALLLPSAAHACVTVYIDAWADSDSVYGSGFVEDYYNSGSCFDEAYYQWWYWEHSYEAEVSIVSPTYQTASITDGMNDVPFGGGFADALAFISTTGDPGVLYGHNLRPHCLHGGRTFC